MGFDEEPEFSEFWDRYYALPFREKIREEGWVTWMTNTNNGVGVALTLLAAASYAFAKFAGLIG